MIESTPKLTEAGLIATPKDMHALERVLESYNGSERTVATICAYQAWNLAAKLTAAPDGFVDVRISKESLDAIITVTIEHEETVEICQQLAEIKDEHDQ